MKPAERVDLSSDDEQSRCFLDLLDPNASIFTFQTLDDDRTRKNPALTHIVQAPLSARDELVKLNEQGAGIFVTINKTNGSGRKSENITGIRAVWQEDDDGFEGPFPLLPSMIVATSPGHFHRYWLLADDWPADERGRADFAAVMERMVESYGSDKNAKDISRVLRVPGFLHRKSKRRIKFIFLKQADAVIAAQRSSQRFPRSIAPRKRTPSGAGRGKTMMSGASAVRCTASTPTTGTVGSNAGWQSSTTSVIAVAHCGMIGRGNPANTTNAIRIGHGSLSKVTASALAPCSFTPSKLVGETKEYIRDLTSEVLRVLKVLKVATFPHLKPPKNGQSRNRCPMASRQSMRLTADFCLMPSPLG